MANTLTGKAVTNAISLYTTSTSGGITLGNSSNTNTINGATTFNQNITFNSQINGIGTTDFSNIPKIATMYQAFGGNSPSGFPTYDVTYNTTIFPNSFRVYGALTTDYTYYANAQISNQQNLLVNNANFNKINFLQICINANSLGSVGGINSVAGIDFTTWAGRTNAGCRIYAQDNNNYSADLLFVTAPSGSASSTPTERIRVMADGNIGINQSNPQYLLDVNGTGRFVSTLYGNTLQGTTVSSAINLYTNSTSGGITLGNSSNTNTINGNTTITNTLLANTLTGKAVTDAISLYTTSTSGGITLGNSSNTITINGVTTLNNYITTSIFNPIVSTNSLLNMILSNKTGSISGQNNTGLGVGSLSALTTGRDNTAIGTNALNTITDQNYNTGVGSGALGAIVTTGIDGGYNTAVGSNAGNSLKYGKYNCFFGQLAGTNMSVSQADYNTFLGSATSFIVPNTGFSYSTAIGFGAVISASNQIMLGRVNETVVAPNNITITNTLNGNTLAGKTTTDAISLYTTSTSGGIILGNSTNTNTIRGNTTIPDTLFIDNVKGLFAGDNISLFTTTTTGTMNFLTGLTSGICYIGNSVSTTGQMIIYGAVSGTSTLFSNVVAGAISIGSSTLTGVMTIYGSISNTNNLFTNVTTGAINIGTSCSGVMTIGKTVQSPNPNSTVNIVATDLPIYGNLQLRGKYGQNIYYLNQSQSYTSSTTLSTPLYQYNIASFSSNGTLTIPDASDACLGIALYFKNACNPSTVTMSIKTVSSNNFFGLTAGSIPTTITAQQIMVVCVKYTFGSPPSDAPVWVQMI